MSEEANIVDVLKRALAIDERPRRPEPFIVSARRQLLEDPSKAAAAAYLWLTAVGFTRIFGDGMGFGVNTVDLASPSDFLLAGLRDPLAALAALASGAALFWMAGKGATDRRFRYAMVPAALAVLGIGVLGSASYRHAVVAGVWNGKSFAPFRSTVTIDHEREGALDTISDARLVLSTAEYFVFYREPDETLIVKKDWVKRIEIHVPRP